MFDYKTEYSESLASVLVLPAECLKSVFFRNCIDVFRDDVLADVVQAVQSLFVYAVECRLHCGVNFVKSVYPELLEVVRSVQRNCNLVVFAKSCKRVRCRNDFCNFGGKVVFKAGLGLNSVDYFD